jgi:hypothetical protein
MLNTKVSGLHPILPRNPSKPLQSAQAFPPAQTITMFEEQKGNGPFPPATAIVVSTQGPPIPFEIKGTRLPSTFTGHMEIEHYDEETVFGLITCLREHLAQGADLQGRIEKNNAVLKEITTSLADVKALDDISEKAVMEFSIMKERLPLLEKRIAELREKMDSVKHETAHLASALRDQIFLMAELIHHGNAALADKPETPAVGPWLGSEINTLAFLLMNKLHYSSRYFDLEAEDIFDLAKSFVSDAETFFTEVTRLENSFNGQIPIRRRGEAAGFASGTGVAAKLFDFERATPVRFFLLRPPHPEHSFGSHGSATVGDGITYHPDHLGSHYGAHNFPAPAEKVATPDASGAPDPKN